jgi:trans-aconitate methyltransferase
MELETGRALIGGAVTKSKNQVWADVGAGDGFFTQVLASLLPNDAVVYAVDKDNIVNEIKSDQIIVKPVVANFSALPQGVPLLEGILFANALHYVRDKKSLLALWQQKLKPGGYFVIVEYDTTRPNQWVPYPAGVESIGNIAKRLNAVVTMLGTAPSTYQSGGLYACKLSWS